MPYKVPYQRLFKNAHGIGGKILGWIENWLTGRKLEWLVLLKLAVYDQWCASRIGFGSIAFLIYINDINMGVVSKLGKFADDKKIGLRVSDDAQIKILINDLAKIFQWSLN